MITIQKAFNLGSRGPVKPEFNPMLRFRGEETTNPQAGNPTNPMIDPVGKQDDSGKKTVRKSFAPIKRLCNAGKQVIGLFGPGGWASTLKRIVISTIVITLMTSVIGGPFVLGMIPIYAAWGLAWEVVSSFVGGLCKSPDGKKLSLSPKEIEKGSGLKG